MKKAWRTPELIILFRGKPEEAVLCTCKHANTAAVSPYNFVNSCSMSPTCCSACSSNTSAS
jgi:flavin reductase (DIM6/NTAB) family NADH-FMN oxidoreductase RutF